MPLHGECLCGKTTVTIENGDAYKGQYTCHCLDCRQTSGTAFSTNILVPKKDLKIEGPVKTFDAPVPTGNIVTRIFCENCGSAISHQSPFFGDSQPVQTGILKDFGKTPIALELFVKDRWPVLSQIEGAVQVEGMPASPP